MPEGIIAGGWAYVIAAYSITALGLAAYIWSLKLRSPKGADDDR